MTDNRLKNLALEVLGCFISALGTYSFAVVAQVPVTGVAGIGAILYHLWGLPIGMTNILLNIPIVLFASGCLGGGSSCAVYAAWVLFAFFTDFVLPALPVYSGDRLLAAVCGGVVMGIGDALIYMQNSSTGGLDFVTMAIKVKHPHMPFGNLTFGAAMAVIIANGLVFRDVDAIIYGILLNFLASTVINKMMFGFNSCMLAMIVTEDGPAVCAAIDEAVDRGVYHPQGLRRLQTGTPGCGALRLQQQTTLWDRKAGQTDGPGELYDYAASHEVQGEGFRRLVLGKGEEKK